MKITLEKVSEAKKHILKNLYSLYLHDLSEYTEGLDLSPDGSFEFDSFDLIWEGKGLTPFFLKSDTSIVGFLLLLERPFLKKDYDYSINDIFILKKYRRKGIAISVLKDLFEEKPGRFFIIELATNTPAIKFWRRALEELNLEYNEEEVLIDEDECLVQTFTV
jgi:predicted acetyltransferase